MSTILITGATGNIGVSLTEHLKKKHNLILADKDFDDLDDALMKGTKIVEKDLTIKKNWNGLLDGVDYVIQLAGNPSVEAEFDELIEMNYALPQYLYEEATKAKSLKRIIFASSIHASNSYPDDVQVKIQDQIRPGNLYGVSKAYLEALASFHAFNNGIESIGVRIGDYKESGSELDPDTDIPHLGMFLSSDDFNQLVDLAMETDLEEPYLLVNAVSGNSFPRLDIQKTKIKLGYEPEEDAFEQADRL